MNYKLILCVLCINIAVFSQNTFFIKYKSIVEKEQVLSRITSKNIFSASDKIFKTDDYSVSAFANGIASHNEVIGRIIKVTFSGEISPSLIIQTASSDPEIDYIQPMTMYALDFMPNDTLAAQQWGLGKIKAYDAWDITTGDTSILIGIIDTGIDYLHPDLTNKIYINPGESGTDNFGKNKNSNGIDDDNNGFIDDYMGWDFTDRVGFPFDSTGGDYLDWDNDPLDQNGHGTYIAGIAGAETNNITGVAGTAPSLKIVNLRAFDPGGYGEEDDVAAAILYAVENGVKVINMSFGDYSFSYVLRDVIQYAYSQNVVMVASAGNSGSPDPHYPSAYPEVISVGNSTINDLTSPQSNWGSSLDLVAPGSVIMTTGRDNNYALISGTSASAPFVSASAGLILSLNNFSNEEVKQVLKSTTDDIGAPGWDERSGAGRLNLFKALSINAPSRIKINHPRQDFATMDDTLKINATVLSPYFSSYELYYGTGLNPYSWTNLVSNGASQFTGEDIYNLNISQLPDSVYCVRLIVRLNNGRTLEERSNFYIIRTPPEMQLVTLAPMLYGERSTIVSAVYTNTPSVVRLYYKKISSPEYSFVTLDGFSMNTQFVKQLHYGFVPVQLIEQNSLYHVYLEAENLVGLKTEVRLPGPDSLVNISYPAAYAASYKQQFSLPPGVIYRNPVNFLSQGFNEVLFDVFFPGVNLYYTLLKMEDDTFTIVDSIKNQIPRDVGDFNNNGLTDMLSTFVREGFKISEQISAGSFDSLVTKYTADSSSFWAARAEDIDFDGVTEVIAFEMDSLLTVSKISSTFNLTNRVKLSNFTPASFWDNTFDYPHITIADLNNNGRNEIWVVDKEGDIFNYEVNEQGSFSQGVYIETLFESSTSYLDAGDFNGDGILELAVLVRSIQQLDIAPFYRLFVFNLIDNQLNMLFDQAFIDASIEFRGSFQETSNALRFFDLNDDGKDELMLFTFPYAYIFSQENGQNKIIHYSENINSNNIFVGDLNKNNVPEVAFPGNEGIEFFEFAISNKAASPYHVSGYSIDSSAVYLSWNGSGALYYIYRGESEENLVLTDTVMNSGKEFTDYKVTPGKYYYYAVQSVDLSKPEPLSNLSRIVKVFSHMPGRVVNVTSNSSRTVIVSLSERINTSIEDIEAFHVEGTGYPNSISPYSQYAYLLTFRQDLVPGVNRLAVNNLKDFYGSPVPKDTLEFTADSALFADEFFISSYELLNQYLVKIIFNLPVDESTVTNTANYEFSPDNKVSSVSVDASDKKIIYIDLKGGKPVGSIGREYRLQIKNIKSFSGLTINSASGSYIVLTGFSKDLSGVYVYPNPARGGEVMFANLPRRAKITIFSINGQQMNSLEENDGNGGIEYDLKDYTGQPLGSGVYVYRIVRLDDSGAEAEEKIGKFAVVR